MSRFIGNVSAYAYAVSQGYTGTEEEYAELMASYATVAQQAAESAESASQSATQASASTQTATTKASEASQSATQAGASATSASQSATTATTKASEASQSAQTATTKASEASASASTASTKAGEASTSATMASTKASEASASATSAQTAQGLAESARDSAIDAKTDAESARDLAQQYADSIDPDNIFSAYATDTASGSVATFTDGADDIPMKSVVVNIEPAQSGSGDPSPDNVRPISGWTGANVVRTGKNLIPDDALEYSERFGVTFVRNADGMVVINGTSTAQIFNRIGTEPHTLNAGHYVIRKTDAPNVYLQVITPDLQTNFGSATATQDHDFTLTESTDVIYRYIIYANGTYNEQVLYPQLELGSTATEYEPYTGNTYPITFPSEAGTVYGGELDVTNGTLTVDRASIASYNGETLPSEWISDRDKYVAGTTPTTGAQVVYELATPITYHLTPMEIKSLLGDNNVWADAGDTEVTYRADTAKYIDKKIAEVINALS